MPLKTYCVYLAALAVGMLTPGPAMLQALTMGMRHGAGPVTAAALGNVCSSVLQVAAALFGLSLLARQPEVFRLAGLAGSVYLAWLGLKLWSTSGRLDLDAGTSPEAGESLVSLFVQGAFVAMVNPKAWGFLAAMLPPFAAGGMPDATTLSLLAAPIALLAFGGMMAYAVCGASLKRILTTPRAMRRFFRGVAVTLWACAGYFAAG
jgi:threonine/homoserine/homoserine lactone efflux protein